MVPGLSSFPELDTYQTLGALHALAVPLHPNPAAATAPPTAPAVRRKLPRDIDAFSIRFPVASPGFRDTALLLTLPTFLLPNLFGKAIFTPEESASASRDGNAGNIKMILFFFWEGNEDVGEPARESLSRRILKYQNDGSEWLGYGVGEFRG
jgi:hypothetical protein